MNREDRYILLLGGLGYLGANIAEYHRQQGEKVIIVSRERSVSRRWFIYEELRKQGVKFYVKRQLSPDYADDIINKYGDPSILYLTIGKLRGKEENMKNSNAILPYLWSKRVFERGCETLVIYISHAFQLKCYKKIKEKKETIILEEDRHLSKCLFNTSYEKTKALGEKLILSIKHNSGSIAIFRPGLLIGRWAYHVEWRLIYQISKLGIRVIDGPRLPITPAKDIPKAASFLQTTYLDKGLSDDWFLVTPYTTSIETLQTLILNELNREKNIRLTLGLMEKYMKIISSLPQLKNLAQPIAFDNYICLSSKLSKLGFNSWTPLREAVKEYARWLEQYNKKISISLV